MTERPVYTVIVAYHAEDELERCLRALDRATEVTVVDNSSSPAVRSVALEQGALCLDPGKNLGFGAGVNLALRQLTGGPPRDVLLLNPDAVVDRRDIEALADHLHAMGNERVGALSPSLVAADGTPQRVVWPFPTPSRAWLDAFGLGNRHHASASFVIGAVLLLRWEAILDTGLFDERFFLYSEETDWQRRATNLGWRSEILEGRTAQHVGAASSVDEPRREALFHAGQETYIRKWHGTAGWWVYRTAVIFGAAARTLVLPGARRSAAKRRAVLYLRGPRRCAFGE